MTPVATTFSEVSAQRRNASAPYAHVSVELGHLYMEDLEAGPERLRAQFRRVAPWVRALGAMWGERLTGRPARISTCFLVDDYFSRTRTPAEVLPAVLEAAAGNGLTIDYIARESACAEYDGAAPAGLVEGRIVGDPPPGTNGSRPPVKETGWLCNGVRSPRPTAATAMGRPQAWAPPAQNAKRGHSVFVDVELWDESGAGRVWSCAFLASVWQLLRLGLLRDDGALPLAPVPRGDAWPSTWDALPAIVKLNEQAAPFTAYTTLSVLSPRFLPVELAVRTILSQVMVDPDVMRDVEARSGKEGVALEGELVDRVSYVFA
ncbi:SCO2522 family protein [Sphaerisporangium aureirubrum]|uniref:SCO2522 family protein n=1 Tax=Sphaerisporangium aureirubrum TaxID=1544736 RepID=A0ABW1NUB6_9ACTN